jgi:chemotaxis protein methyltransferase CheR
LREITVFQPVNLTDSELPLSGAFDAILFRNVSIYWSDETAETVLTRLASLIDTDGILLVGPSDPVGLPRNQWEHLIRNSVRCYRRRSPEEIATTTPPIPSIREVARARVRPPESAPTVQAPALPDPRTNPPVDRRVSRPQPPSPVLITASSDDLDLIDDPVQSCLAQTRELADAGRYSDAIALLEDHEAGASVQGKLWRGILSLSLEHDEEAVRLFRQCVFLRPDVAEYHRWLGVALEAVGRTTEAARTHSNAAELDEL